MGFMLKLRLRPTLPKANSSFWSSVLSVWFWKGLTLMKICKLSAPNSKLSKLCIYNHRLFSTCSSLHKQKMLLFKGSYKRARYESFLLQLQLNWETVISSLCPHLQWMTLFLFRALCLLAKCSPFGSGGNWRWWVFSGLGILHSS